MVLYLGQLSPRKRVDDVVRAVAAMERRDIRLVIAGADRGMGGALDRLAERVDGKWQILHVLWQSHPPGTH